MLTITTKGDYMKKAPRLLLTLAFTALITVSVYANNGTLRFTIDGDTIQTDAEAFMNHYGNYYSNSAINVDFLIISEHVELYFEMFVPNGNNRLIPGTYNLSTAGHDDHGPFTYSYGEIDVLLLEEIGYEYFDVLDGTLTITTTGAGANLQYIVAFNLTLEDEFGFTVPMTGEYRGSIEWEDHSN